MHATGFLFRQTLKISAFALPVLFLAACAGTGGRAAAPRPPEAVVARVNGEPIRQAEVNDLVADYVQQTREDDPNVTDVQIARLRPRMSSDALEELIDNKLIQQAIRHEDIKVGEDQVEARLRTMDEELRREGLSLEGLRESTKTTPEKLREGVRQKIAYDRFWERRLNLKAPTDAAMRRFYAENQKFFTAPPAYHLHDAFVPFPSDHRPTRAERRDLRAKAEALRARLAAGEAFDAVARDAARRQTQGGAAGPENGDLGWVPEGAPLPTDVMKTAASLPVGRISDIVESSDGFHVLLVSEKRPGHVIPFDQVRPQLAVNMQRMERDRQIPDELKKMRQAARIEKL